MYVYIRAPCHEFRAAPSEGRRFAGCHIGDERDVAISTINRIAIITINNMIAMITINTLAIIVIIIIIDRMASLAKGPIAPGRA